MKKARLIVAIITNLLDEAVIVALIIFGLPRLGVHIPLYGIVLICIAFLIYAVIFYRIGSTAIMKRPLPGLTDMVSLEGRAASKLEPQGYVRIGGELWTARAENGPIEAGAEVVVIKQQGFKLVVRAKME